MKRYLTLLLLWPALVNADYFNVEGGGDGFVGPALDEIELISIEETSVYGSERPLSVKVRNNSDLYLDRVAIECTITDWRGHRAFKDIVFKSKPIFSIDFAIWPIKTPEMGIPPGATADVGLYTDDNRWMRGRGSYKYDCDIHGVAGRE
jgi:hypothetical protein